MAETAPLPADVQAAQEQNINPWSVSGEVDADGKVKPIDYAKLVDQFGTKLIDQKLLDRFEKVTGRKAHRYLRREIVFSHRDLEAILDRYEKKEPFFIYTGRGPSSDILHIGHVVPFMLTKWLGDVFDVPVVIMLTDDEKYLISKMERTTEEFEHFARENAKDIIAIGFDVKKTFIFSDYSFMGGDFYRNVTRIAKRISVNDANKSFGFDLATNIGKVHFAAIQAAPAFANSFPTIFGSNGAKTSAIPALIPCAIDQDPYFRLTRDVAHLLKFAKPSLIHARFLDALQGPGSKMSASNEASSILVRDSPKQIQKKVRQFAFSGGKETLEEHREKGGDVEIDVPFSYLRFFLDDDDELEQIRTAYSSGQMLTSEIKDRCAAELSKFCEEFQKVRATITDEILDEYMTPRPLMCRGVLSNTIVPEALTVRGKDVANPESKNQAKKAEKMRLAELKKAEKKREKGSGEGKKEGEGQVEDRKTE